MGSCLRVVDGSHCCLSSYSCFRVNILSNDYPKVYPFFIDPYRHTGTAILIYQLLCIFYCTIEFTGSFMIIVRAFNVFLLPASMDLKVKGPYGDIRPSSLTC